MKRTATIATAMLALSLVLGCASQTPVPINTAYPFEKRYSKGDSITINGKKVEIPAGKSVWVLTSDTLNNLLIYAGGERLE